MLSLMVSAEYLAETQYGQIQSILECVTTQHNNYIYFPSSAGVSYCHPRACFHPLF